MGFFLASNAFLWQSLIIGSAVFWATSTLAYLFTRRISVAFFTQALMMTLTYGLSNWFFALLVSCILSLTLARTTRSRILSAGMLMLPAIISEAVFDIYGTIVWGWEWTFNDLLSYIIGSALAAPSSIVVGKIFKRC